jgi:acyl-CoA thioesterase II
VSERDGSLVGQSPTWFGRHVFGGILLAQSLDAARSTVPDGLRARSLHAYFLTAASADAPVRYEVESTKDGRSASTRAVRACQDERVVLTMLCSFAGDRDGRAYDLGPDQAIPEPEMPPVRPVGRQLRRRALEDLKQISYAGPGPEPQVLAAGQMTFVDASLS